MFELILDSFAQGAAPSPRAGIGRGRWPRHRSYWLGNERRGALGVSEGNQQTAAGSEGSRWAGAVLMHRPCELAGGPRGESLGKPQRRIAARVEAEQQRAEQQEQRNRRYENLDHRAETLAHRPNPS
jgi:hypothetical protein